MAPDAACVLVSSQRIGDISKTVLPAANLTGILSKQRTITKGPTWESHRRPSPRPTQCFARPQSRYHSLVDACIQCLPIRQAPTGNQRRPLLPLLPPYHHTPRTRKPNNGLNGHYIRYRPCYTLRTTIPNRAHCRHATAKRTWRHARVRACFMYIPQSQRNQIKPSRRALCTVLYVCRKRVNDGRQNDSEEGREGRREREGRRREQADDR